MSRIASTHPAFGVLFGTTTDRCLSNGEPSDHGGYGTVEPASLPGFVVKTCHRPHKDAFVLWVWLVLQRKCSGPFDPYIQAVHLDPENKSMKVVMRELQTQGDRDRRNTTGSMNCSMYETLAEVGAVSLYADFVYLSDKFDCRFYCDLHGANWMKDGARFVCNDPLVYSSGDAEWSAVVAAFRTLSAYMPDRVFIEEPQPVEKPVEKPVAEPELNDHDLVVAALVQEYRNHFPGQQRIKLRGFLDLEAEKGLSWI